MLPQARFGVAEDCGGRPYHDDTHALFSLCLPDGRRFTVAAVLDGHHQHHVAQLARDHLPRVMLLALREQADVSEALASACRKLDDLAYEVHAQGLIRTGGTTLLVHVLSANEVYTAAVGDCKALISVKGAPEALNTCHNPDQASERERFAAAGIQCAADHIQDSDINVCRTIGDYDLGPPLKWRDTGGSPAGPLIPEPEISVHAIDAIDEFIVSASDGLWDYYTPESSVLTDARRALRASKNDAQHCADWLVKQALARQRGTLHAGTPGDNVTVLITSLRPLPQIPRASASRLNLRAGSCDMMSPKESDLSAAGGAAELLWSPTT